MGFRIFVHSSAMARSPAYDQLELLHDEVDERASAELVFSTTGDEISKYLQNLSTMRADVRKERALRHYAATEKALNRFATLP
jgi:hypothetical protein